MGARSLILTADLVAEALFAQTILALSAEQNSDTSAAVDWRVKLKKMAVAHVGGAPRRVVAHRSAGS